MWRARNAALAIIALAGAVTNPAWGVTCNPDANGSYLAGWTAAPLPTNCNQIPATSGSPTVLGTNASWYVLARSALTAPNDVVTIDAPTNISYTGANGFGPVIGNQYLTHGSINFTDVTATIANTGVNGGIIGLSTSLTLPMIGSNFTLTATSGNYTGGNSSGTVASYAILAGSSVNAGEAGTANNGKFSTITLDNATINQTYAGGLIQPVLNSGLRSIQGAYLDSGNGSTGKIEFRGALDMTLTGARIEGVYVSGAASDGSGNEAVSQVVLKDGVIKMLKSSGTAYDSSAIKIGKTRVIGTGKGLVVSNGALKIDMDSNFGGAAAYMSPAIKMAVSGSKLLANGPGSSADIKAARSALAIGIDDWGSNVDSQGIQASFGKATVRTQSATAPLLLVDSGQQDVQMLFDRSSDLTAASNGYLIDVVKYRTSTATSSVRLMLDNASIAKGLANRSYANSTLDIDLENVSIWNLVEKTNGDKTSTYSTFGLKSGSLLNAFKSGTASFVMNGPVTSDASIVNLLDGAPDDVLTIQPSYAGNNGATLMVDTCMGDDTAPSDVLKVTGDTNGTTVLKVTPSPGMACGGALTAGNGILVVLVSGASNGVFVLDGGTIIRGNFVYRLVKVGNDWYLQSELLTGTIVVQKQVNAPVGTPPYGGGIGFVLSCDGTPINGTIDVVNNAGASDPVVVSAGSQCEVSETLPTPPPNYVWGSPSYSSLAPVEAGSTQTALITNTLIRQASTIGLTKTVTGGPPGGVTGSFGFTADCGADGTFAGTVVLAGATTGTGSIANVPAGATCSIGETTIPAAPANYQWGATPPAVSVTTTPAGPNTAAFINTLTRQTSTIGLTKTVTGGPPGGVTGSFGFTADCGADGTFAGTVVLAGATTGTGSIADVPAGATCSIGETTIPAAPANYQWGATPPAVSVTTTPAGPNTAAFINTLVRDLATLTVTKQVTGAPASGAPGTYDFTVSCEDPAASYDGSVTLTGTQTSGISGAISIPAGSTGCTIAEDIATRPAAPPNHDWEAPAYTQPPSIIAGSVDAAIVNPLKSQPGPIQEALPVPVDRRLLFWLIAGIGLIGSLLAERRRL